MSNNIYDILNKLSKSIPVSTVEAEPIYESVDPRGDIIEAINTLEAKFSKFNPNDEAEDKYLNPQAKRFVQLAKAKFPETSSDLEAVVAAIGDKTEELDTRDQETAEWMNKAKATIGQQQKEIEQTEQAVVDANARYDAQEKRFQDFNRQVASAELDVKQQAQAALDYAKQPEAKPQDIISKTQATTKTPQAVTPTPAQPKNVVQFPSTPAATPAQPPTPAETPPPETPAGDKTDATDKKSKLSLVPDTGRDYTDIDTDKLGSFFGGDKKTVNARGLEEAVQMIYPEGSPALGQFNLEKIKKAYIQKLPKVDLIFGDSAEKLTDADIYAIAAWFYLKSKQNADLLPNLAARNLSTQKDVQRLLRTDMVNHYRSRWGSLKRSLAQKNTATQPLDFNKPKAPEPQQQQPATVKPVVQPKKGQLDLFNENNTMKTTKPLEESLMERFATFKEAAKPDFLDLDKDGDKIEPMKSAAKDAEPDKPDADAVAKRKRLQALKDKQEDERAEKGDYDSKSSTRVVKGRAYGGAAQKDDEDKDLDESGLQAYLGKKKYGKEGMKALQQAGRDGASKEKMAKLRARHDKFDESAKPDYIDLDKDGDKKEPMKKAAKDAKQVDEGKMKDIHYDLMRLADKKGYTSKKQFTPADYDELAKPHGISGKELAMAIGHKKASQVAEVAPPGAKAERMVKHIKKGYAKDGNLSKKEKGIAYATAWKAKKAGKLEESRNAESSEYTYETIGRVLCDEQPHLDANSEAFVKAVYDELIEMKLTPKAARWLVHYDEDFISDCATSYGHFCASKEKEMAECGAPVNSFVSEEPLLDAVQELDEIAKLAGLAPKMEAKCSSCGCADCSCNENLDAMSPSDSASPLTYAGCPKCNADPCCCEEETAMDEGMGCSEEELNEAATRKDFRAVAELLKNIEDVAKRTELAMHHADIFKEQNPRFKREMFLAAAGVDTTPIEKDEVVVDEAEMGEGNEFSGALAAAKASGAKEFEVDGKKYTVKEDINVNVSANGEEDVVNLIRKLSGMPVIAIQAQPAMAEEVVAEEGPKERDVEYTNTPREEVAGTDAAIPSGTDLNRAKKQYRKEYPGDNPMAVKEAIQNMLWNDYQSMINDVKA
jgi:hypothetical protein